MPKRKKPQTRDWRRYSSVVVNVLVAVSMILGTVVVFTGGAFTQRQVPPDAPVEIPTLAPTVGAPLPTPQPTNTLPARTPTP